MANEAVLTLKDGVDFVSKQLCEIIHALENIHFNDCETAIKLFSQLKTIRADFDMLPDRITKDISTLSKTAFSIVLFGRTMEDK